MTGRFAVRIGILCDRRELRVWQRKTVDRLRGAEGLEVSLHFFEESGAASGAFRPPRWLASYVDRRLSRRVPDLGRDQLRDEPAGVPAADYDLVVNLAPGPPDPAWIARSGFGVLSLTSRGSGTPALVALHHRQAIRRDCLRETRVTFHLRRPEGSFELAGGNLRTHPSSLAEILRVVLRAVPELLVHVAQSLRLGQSGRLLSRAAPAAGGDLRWPTFAGALADLAVLAKRSLVHWLEERFFLDLWAIGVIPRPVAEVLDGGLPKDVAWIRPRERFRFFADPCALVRDGKLMLLFEDFAYTDGTGRIACCPVDESGSAGEVRGVLERPYHLSYPYLIETAEGEVFMLPESSLAGRSVLYRFTRFPDVLEAGESLLGEIKAVDSTIFRHQDRWWLWTTDSAVNGLSMLYLWYADDLAGPWTPHPLNPVKCDLRSSRPAGRPFRWRGELVRPAQDGAATYGAAVTLNRVVELSPTRFEEVPVAELRPRADWPYPDGLHTLWAVAGWTIIDAKRSRFSLAAPFLFWRARRRTPSG